ncbi:hypothetical protein AZF37_05240 [endosymbiont 'TC1' of Trimyema compressum]|uniref:InlB B-repeat-containing protein n=1 Tax=endosymbiont 'TC1' of Trimyema compressum TaxID=243899 RepID=UPI0007F0ADB7|nr:InlB B-repeat-containing protein [endosymbiont 'TC1' of Trimyema compressum]AMP20662.1 hypothetical protein AZF37_05240 [endosymbiont 'TC1' of Trimyema compressum]
MGLATSVLDPSYTGYIFKGWNTAKDGTGVTWDFNTSLMPNNDVTLFAQWKGISHNLVFNINGGDRSTPNSQIIATDDFATSVSNPIRNGYSFVGWNTAPDGSGIAWDFSNTKMPNQDIMLYAIWKLSNNSIANTFSDYSLALAIADAIADGDVNASLTDDMITNCTILNLESKGIVDLREIGKLVNLRQLLLKNNEIMILPPEMRNLINLDYLTLDNQNIFLPTIQYCSFFKLVSPIKNQKGEIVPPKNSSGNYSINGNEIIWYNLDAQIKLLSFTFEDSVVIGNATANYSGTVNQPLTFEKSNDSLSILNISSLPKTGHSVFMFSSIILLTVGSLLSGIGFLKRKNNKDTNK